VRLDHIAPDLAMVHLDRHKIKWSDLEKEETQVIGVGTAPRFRPPTHHRTRTTHFKGAD
jgi:hypothetical protein